MRGRPRPDGVAVVYNSRRPPPDLNHPADDPRLTVEMRAVVAGARRRAVRDGDRQVDTAHLLHSLLERDPAARAACDAGTGRIDRVLGYLVQRSIGYGMRWSGSVENSGALPLVTAVTPGWSPAATAAMRAAMAAARRDGRDRADGTDLLDALAAEPRCRAMQVLRAAGIEPGPRGFGEGRQRAAGPGDLGAPRSPGDDSRYRDDGPVAS